MYGAAMNGDADSLRNAPQTCHLFARFAAVQSVAQSRRITMRLLSRAALGLAATLFVAPALQAQASFSVAAGATVPMGGTADQFKTGYNITAGIGIKPPLAPLGFRFEGML